MTSEQKRLFIRKIYAHYRAHGRNLPWRKTRDPYAITVSEIMCQQTQVERVVPKYTSWLRNFPTWKNLAEAPLSQVLALWSGLGYNRRGKLLQDLAKMVIDTYQGELPAHEGKLKQLPGIGAYTAGALMAFAFNQPVVVLDTNIRSVYIYEFFPNQTDIPDSQIIPLIKETLDKKNPRPWYNALMDFGAWLKKRENNPSRLSLHYLKQSPLKGSVREVRGWILKELNTKSRILKTDLETYFDDTRIEKAIEGLIKDGLVIKENGLIRIT